MSLNWDTLELLLSCSTSNREAFKSLSPVKTTSYPFIHNIAELIRNCMRVNEEFRYLLEIKADKPDKYYTGIGCPLILRISKDESFN